MQSVRRILIHVKVGKITVSRELEALLEALTTGWNRRK